MTSSVGQVLAGETAVDTIASADLLVSVDGVSKRFCRSLKRSLWYGMQDIVGELLPSSRRRSSAASGKIGLREGEFWASKDISFELRRGECLGLIGHNGAGKTTLLRMINGLIVPDSGLIQVRGRVGALIALGAGFNPILSGRENIYVYGAVLGLTKREIDERIDEIIAFSELEEFIDSPVQSYSSGMAVRLGFAVATAMDPDVLILDEVLAVGDVAFVIKSLNRVRQMAARAAVILVSHNMQSIASFCNRVILLEHGRVALDTRAIGEAVDQYGQMVKNTAILSGTGGMVVRELVLDAPEMKEIGGIPQVVQGSQGRLKIVFELDSRVERCHLIPCIADETSYSLVSFPWMDSDGKEMEFGPGVHEVTVPLGPLEMNPGNYSFVIVALDCKTLTCITRYQGLHPFRVRVSGARMGKLTRRIRIEPTWVRSEALGGAIRPQ